MSDKTMKLFTTRLPSPAALPITARRLASAPFFRRGNTIIELLIVTMIVGMVLTALAATMTVSLRNTSEANFREHATSLASEPIEFLRSHRSAVGWTQFQDEMETEFTAGTTYCLELDPDNETLENLSDFSSGSCTAVALDSVNQDFTRTMIVTNITDAELTVTSTVSWPTSGGASDVTLEQTFHQF